MSLFNELKRRNVIKVAIAYTVVAWLMIEVSATTFPMLMLPEWTATFVTVLLMIGFPLALIFAWAYELTPEGLKKEKDIDRDQSITHVTGRKLDYFIIALLVLALGYFAFDKFVLDPSRDAELVQATTEAVTEQVTELGKSEAAEKSIAVLPFVNMSSDPEQGYFADGISEEILNALAKVGGLKVAGRTSSFAFKGKADDLKAIGQALRVSHILEGSVRKSGNRIRITAQLIEVDGGYHLWSETWDREIEDIFVIQDEISQAILGEMKTQLLGELEQTASADTRAYELYLSAKQMIYNRNQASLQRAAEFLAEAITLDEQYAPALAQMGIATILLSDGNYGSIPETEARQTALEHLERALQLDAGNAEALAGMGLYYADMGSTDAEAVEWLRKALAVNPNLVNANTWLSNALSGLGKLRESIEVLERNHERDPFHRPTYSNLANRYAVTGRADEALQMLSRLEAFLPGDGNVDHARGKVNWYSGHLADAVVNLQRAYELDPVNRVNQLWYSGALMWLMEFEQAVSLEDTFIGPGSLTRMGRTEEALIVAGKHVGEGGFPLFYLEALGASGRHAEMIRELEARWGGLEEFEEMWPNRDGAGGEMLAYLALAYRQLGDEQAFTDAMLRLRASLDAQLSEGADNWRMSAVQAYYALLADDFDSALGHIERMVEQGAVYNTAWKSEQSFVRPLRGEPRFEAARAIMIQRVNDAREELGLEPVDV